MTKIFHLMPRAAIVAGILAATLPFQGYAAEGSPTAKQLLSLIQDQQRQLDTLKEALAKAQANAAAAEEKSTVETSSAPGALQSIQISGAIEVEATAGETFTGVDSSDITLAKVEVALDAAPSEFVSAHVQVLYEDDGNENITLDEAFATLGNTEKFPVYLQVGKWAMPFGGFDSDMNTGPLTKGIGETKEAAVLVGGEFNGISLAGYIYNGDSQQSGSGDKIDQAGLSLGYSTELEKGNIDFGAGYIRNIADSDGLTTGLDSNATALSDYVGGVEVHAALSYQDVTVRAGFMTALSAFKSGELAFSGQGAKPKAWNLEGAYTTEVGDRDVTVAATVQGTDEALALSLPELRYGAAATVGITESTSITAEYLHDEDYDTNNGGTGNSGHTATVKLAVGF